MVDFWGKSGYVVRGVGWGGGVFLRPGDVRPLSGKFWRRKPYGSTGFRQQEYNRAGADSKKLRKSTKPSEIDLQKSRKYRRKPGQNFQNFEYTVLVVFLLYLSDRSITDSAVRQIQRENYEKGIFEILKVLSGFSSIF